MAKVELKHIDKIYDNGVQAVYDFNLEINDGEFIVLVGPSGCGKSTTLRMIAGLEDISDGELLMDGEYCNDVLPKNRDLAMVFQNYALYPHMSVYQNMAFGLKNRHMAKTEIDVRIKEAAGILELTDYLNTKPKNLSGGQCQRVALGRAIVRHAPLFLMDEPLSNLDAKLRVQMRSEIIKLHRNIGAITIYVTHDQTEAMTMADRIVVMEKGRIQQIGTPREIYEHPANLFVAGFIGSPSMNFIDAKYNDGAIEIPDGYKVPLNEKQQEIVRDLQGKDVILGVRPEDIEVKVGHHKGGHDAIVDVLELLGHEEIIHTKLGEQDIQIVCSSKIHLSHQDEITISFPADYIHCFDKETGAAYF